MGEVEHIGTYLKDDVSIMNKQAKECLAGLSMLQNSKLKI